MPDIEVERQLPAPPDAVWEELVRPESLSAWYWPASFDTDAAIEPRVGGLTRIHSRANDMEVKGEVTAVEPARELTTTWQWDGEELITQVSVALSPTGSGGTKLRATHVGFPDDHAAADYVVGWNDCLDRLAARLH